MGFSLNNIVALINRNEPLPIGFAKALRNVADLTFNRGIYTIAVDDLYAALELDLDPNVDLIGAECYVNSDNLYKVVSILSRQGVSMIPLSVPCTLSVYSTVYLLKKPDLNLDQDVALITRFAKNRPQQLTNRELDSLKRAQEKLRNYNILVRIFECLGAAQSSPLDANQRSVLSEIMSNMMLPHDGERYLRSVYTYACDYGSFQYLYDQPKYFSKPLAPALQESVIDTVARIIAPSHQKITVPDNFPWKALLEQRYKIYCPQIFDLGGSASKESLTRIPLRERQLSVLTLTQKRNRLKKQLDGLLSSINAAPASAAAADESEANTSTTTQEAVAAAAKAAAAAKTSALSAVSSAADVASRVDNTEANKLRQQLLQQRMGFSADFLRRVEDIAAKDDPSLTFDLQELQQHLLHDEDVRLRLPDFAHSRLELFLPPELPPAAQRVVPLVQLDPNNMDDVRVRGHLVKADGSQSSVPAMEQVLQATAHNYNYNMAGITTADAASLELQRLLQSKISNFKTKRNQNVDDWSMERQNLKASAYLRSNDAPWIDPATFPAFASDATNKNSGLMGSWGTAQGANLKRDNPFHVVGFCWDRLTHLYHSYMVWAEDSEHPWPNLNADYGSNLLQFVLFPLKQLGRLDRLNCFEFILRKMFAAQNASSALDEHGRTDEVPLQLLFELELQNDYILQHGCHLPLIFYHSLYYFDKYLEHPATHFNNELFYLELLQDTPFALNIYLSRICHKYGSRLIDIPHEFYGLLALAQLFFPLNEVKQESRRLLQFLLAPSLKASNNFAKVVTMRRLAHWLGRYVQEQANKGNYISLELMPLNVGGGDFAAVAYNQPLSADPLHTETSPSAVHAALAANASFELIAGLSAPEQEVVTATLKLLPAYCAKSLLLRKLVAAMVVKFFAHPEQFYRQAQQQQQMKATAAAVASAAALTNDGDGAPASTLAAAEITASTQDAADESTVATAVTATTSAHDVNDYAAAAAAAAEGEGTLGMAVEEDTLGDDDDDDDALGSDFADGDEYAARFTTKKGRFVPGGLDKSASVHFAANYTEGNASYFLKQATATRAGKKAKARAQVGVGGALAQVANVMPQRKIAAQKAKKAAQEAQLATPQAAEQSAPQTAVVAAEGDAAVQQLTAQKQGLEKLSANAKVQLLTQQSRSKKRSAQARNNAAKHAAAAPQEAASRFASGQTFLENLLQRVEREQSKALEASFEQIVQAAFLYLDHNQLTPEAFAAAMASMSLTASAMASPAAVDADVDSDAAASDACELTAERLNQLQAEQEALRQLLTTAIVDAAQMCLGGHMAPSHIARTRALQQELQRKQLSWINNTPLEKQQQLNDYFAPDCDARVFGSNSPFGDELLEPLYQRYVVPVLRRLLFKEQRCFYAFYPAVEHMKELLTCLLQYTVLTFDQCTFTQGASKRVLIDSFVYEPSEAKYASLRQFALRVQEASALGFADGIPYSQMLALEQVLRHNLKVQLVPHYNWASRDQLVLRPFYKQVRVLSLPEELQDKEMQSYLESLLLALFLSYVALELLYAVTTVDNEDQLMAMLVKELNDYLHLRGDYSVSFVYEYVKATLEVIKDNGALSDKSFLQQLASSNKPWLPQLLGQHMKHCFTFFRHLLMVLFGCVKASNVHKEKVEQGYKLLEPLFKLDEVHTGRRPQPKKGLMILFNNAEEMKKAHPVEAPRLELDMQKIQAKLKESEQVQQVITQLREQEEALVQHKEQELNASLAESDRAQSAQAAAEARAASVAVAAASAATASVFSASAATTAASSAQPSAGIAQENEATPAVQDSAAGAAAAATERATPRIASEPVPATTAATDSGSVTLASKLGPKERSVIEAIAVQGTDAMVYSEFNGICVSHGLISGNYCIEVLNEYAFAEYDEPVLELDGSGEGAIVYITTDLLQDMYKKSRAL
ncbi:MAG: hypothetical protein H9847_10020 [Candidatus Anaerobiospirillum pullicola]|uniref:TerB-C domain-containing protein n=1 Tax=Candidatus Anaerobiospirillum pullicola TaxID=2838451 RepID=A0A948THU1_9GAMM|nr:hypothetical protein [Candidatus Anaerobiospirillum pullicola]